MGNLYALTKGSSAILEFTPAFRSEVGNLEPLPGVFPNMAAPIVPTGADGSRELVRARWGMPSPRSFVKGETDSGVTNIRNTASPHWRRWLGPEGRCVMPVTSFSEYAIEPNPETGTRDPVWFALDENRPLFVFAGLWTPWQRRRKRAVDPADH